MSVQRGEDPGVSEGCWARLYVEGPLVIDPQRRSREKTGTNEIPPCTHAFMNSTPFSLSHFACRMECGSF